MIVVVERFAVLAYDRHERYARAVLQRDAVDSSGDLLFDDSRPAHVHYLQVHFGADRAGAFDLRDFLRVFDFAQCDDRFSQRNRDVLR